MFLRDLLFIPFRDIPNSNVSRIFFLRSVGEQDSAPWSGGPDELLAVHPMVNKNTVKLRG